MVKSVAAAAILAALSAVPVLAQGRPDARTMSCGEVQALLDASGAVVLTTGQHVYDRYVSGRRFCTHPDMAAPARIATRDVASCPVYRCVPMEREDTIWRLR